MRGCNALVGRFVQMGGRGAKGWCREASGEAGERGAGISWYPGHIAKAEKELKSYLKNVDVVIEVRDVRIPFSTRHPSVPEWVGSRPLIVVIMHIDQVTADALRDWKHFFKNNPAHPGRTDAPVFFVDGKIGSGVSDLKAVALTYSSVVNKKRERLGIQPRAVRAAVIGFPNVGKSALINKLLGKTMARSRDLPGVTRALTWVRLGGSSTSSQEGQMDLLDSPGIIPAKHLTQHTAMRLAICNAIGGASYDAVIVAATMCDEINRVYKDNPKLIHMTLIEKRYKIPFHSMDGEDILYSIAENLCDGCLKSASAKLLADFRSGRLGKISIEHVGMAKEAMLKPEQKPCRSKNLKRVKRNNIPIIAAHEVFAPDTSAAVPHEADFDGEELEVETISLLKEMGDAVIDKGEYDGW